MSVNSTPSHLPESPPDSGSEPPYSPIDLHGLNLAATNVNQLTELHLTNACTNGNQTTNSDYQQDAVLPTKNLEQSVLELSSVGEMHGNVYLNSELDVPAQPSSNRLGSSATLCLKSEDILMGAASTGHEQIVLQQVIFSTIYTFVVAQTSNLTFGSFLIQHSAIESNNVGASSIRTRRTSCTALP